MIVHDDHHDDAGHECPGCRMRRQLTDAIKGDRTRAELVDQLLDAVESVRLVRHANDSDRETLIDDAIEELLHLDELIVARDV